MKIPKDVEIRQTFIYVNFTYTDGTYEYWSSLILPLQIRPLTLQAFFWTESFAPVVDGSVQTFYVYAYYGTYEDFPNAASFIFPANMSNIIIRQNTTKTSAVLIKGASNTTDKTGLASFSVISNFNDTYYIQ